ncbi:Pimeloyl-ACP methyl ester carboxylesterase [Polaribacter sp. Hel1_33_78]|jgi:pimeloyl-ACP methyl ester carboxylesterase|uniref:alpha/beta fold hydrolase n=1 Tax=Polaribacter sp. Hel1_33_78 TaxID=1336804 RepID=UPI00087B6F04|nr:alpha/beta hydrolase [Polaribacter sp. Hel1_33_78]MBT7816410.1 alpha/beta hydrolase [Polaribacter sp.]SDU08263.1 Pimeloyl-ACP methyl ester carboxylesterase [Polaribacter sp. Hel1_33_78]
MTTLNWKDRGTFYSVSNKKIFVIDEGTSKDVLVILHGYPTSSFDYEKILPELSKHYRVIIHDHPGFGFSDKPDSLTYSLIDQADFALQLWYKMGLKEVTILAHDYGTSVAKEILARKNHNQITIKIKKVFLCNSSKRLEYFHLRNMDQLLKNKRLGSFIAQLEANGVRKIKKKITIENQPKNDIQKVWNNLNSDEGKKEVHLLSNFINQHYTFWHRWAQALKESKIPIKIIWERNDPSAVKEIAIVLATENGNHNLEWLENTRHYSILDTPKHWLKLVFKFNCAAMY